MQEELNSKHNRARSKQENGKQYKKNSDIIACVLTY